MGSGTLLGLTDTVVGNGISGAVSLMGGSTGSLITFGIVLALVGAVVYGIYRIMNFAKGSR